MTNETLTEENSVSILSDVNKKIDQKILKTLKKCFGRKYNKYILCAESVDEIVTISLCADHRDVTYLLQNLNCSINNKFNDNREFLGVNND